MAYSITKTRIIDILIAKRNQFEEKSDLVVDDAQASAQLANSIATVNELLSDLSWLFKYPISDEEWTHLDNLDSTNNFSCFGKYELVTEDEVYKFISERVQVYFAQNFVHDDELDFFYIDYMVAVSYRYLSKKMGDADFSKAYPKLYRAIDKFDGDNILALIYYAIGKLIKYVIFTFIIVILVQIYSDGSELAGLVAIALIIYKIYTWVAQVNKFSKLQDITKSKLNKLKKLYELMSDGVLRWKVISDDVKLLRELDVDLPVPILTAINKNYE
jgi:hypothetical protein